VSCPPRSQTKKKKLFECFEAEITFRDMTKKAYTFTQFARGYSRDIYHAESLGLVVKLHASHSSWSGSGEEYELYQEYRSKLQNLVPRIYLFLPDVQPPWAGFKVDVLVVEKVGMTFGRLAQLLMDDVERRQASFEQVQRTICSSIVGIFQLWQSLPLELTWEEKSSVYTYALSSDGHSWCLINTMHVEPCEASNRSVKIQTAFHGKRRLRRNSFAVSLRCTS
jgi:hypothetical protein